MVQPVSGESPKNSTAAYAIPPVHTTHDTATTADAASDGVETFITYKVITGFKMFKIRKTNFVSPLMLSIRRMQETALFWWVTGGSSVEKT